MKERLLTLGFALGALLVFILLFVHVEPESPAASLPTTAERGPGGLFAARAWLAGEKVATRAVRARFDSALAGPQAARTGNLLIVSLPVVTPFTAVELNALDQWLRKGNTLLVLAAIADAPGWAAPGRSGLDTDLGDLTGLDYLVTRRPHRETAARDPGVEVATVARRFDEPLRTTLVPNRAHAYLAGVRQAVAFSDYPWRWFPQQTWSMSVPEDGFMLCLARQRESDQDALWVRPRAGGTIIVSGFSSLFSNRALGTADNARLLANIVAASLGPSGTVLFDDEHQGVSETYDPARFYRDPRLYATLGVLAALWLAWVLGATRLRLPVERQAAPRETQLVRTTGAFLARALTPAAAARRLFTHFFRRLHGRAPAGADPLAPSWELLEYDPRIARADLERLRAWYAAAHSGDRVPLVALHNLMIRIERQLAA